VTITGGVPVSAGVFQSVFQYWNTGNRMNVKPVAGGVLVSQSISSLFVRRRITYGASEIRG